MKHKLLFGFLSLTFLGGIALSQNKEVIVTKTATAISIDGTIDAAWSLAKQIDLDKVGKDKTLPDKSDFSGNFKLLWDDDYLYFLGTIYDDVIMDQAACVTAAPADWEVDNFELYWSPANSKLADATELIQVRLSYANVGSADPTATTKNGYSEDGFTLPDFVQAARVDIAGGYIIEAAIDLAVSAEAIGKSSIGAKDTVGFNVIGCDNDGTDKRKNIVSSIEGAQWNEADTLLRLVLSTDAANAVSKLKSKSNVVLFPNPVKNVLRISSKETVNVIEIFNMQGQIVLRANNPGKLLNVAGFPSGLYNARIYTEGGGVVSKKIIKK